MTSTIEITLTRLFDKHRIVFWYDAKQEFVSDFEQLEIKGVEKIEINNNEFGIKYKILREEPKKSFLLYKQAKQPQPFENWLLDVEISHAIFRTDQSAIWLSEMGLTHEFSALTEDHAAFFDASKAKVQAQQRKGALKKLHDKEDSLNAIRLKMLAICAGCPQQGDTRLDRILELLLDEQCQAKQPAFALIERCNLSAYLWKLIEQNYGYDSESPSIKDFVIELFKSCYAMELNQTTNKQDNRLRNESLVFLKRWKDSRNHQIAFENFSHECSDVLNIEEDLNDRNKDELIEIDYFKLIDNKIIHELVTAVEQGTNSHAEIIHYCRQRRQSHWYGEFVNLYSAVEVASEFFTLLDDMELDIPNPSDGIQRYTSQWYKLDQLYRQYVYALRISNQTTLLNSLSDKVERYYSNRFVLSLSNNWQQQVDAMQAWKVADVIPQTSFFNRWVQPYLTKKKKVYVIISDAFRFEAGEEMMNRINNEDRFQAQIDHCLSALPSYTQLGMASLLPQSIDMPLQFADNKTGSVFMGKQSTQGTVNRDKILKKLVGQRAGTLTAKDLMELTRSEIREFLKAHDVIYIYHNRIDHTGDKMQSEGEAFEATQKTFEDLMNMIKKLTNANASNILITADHGFLYQNKALETSDFIDGDLSGDLLYTDRRFVLGHNIKSDSHFKSFTSKDLGLNGDVQVVIPKGIHRLRKSGSGSRFVHGGATLQEVIVPVISINKKRKSDISIVDVDILRSGSSYITSGQLSVTLYQKSALTDKLHPRELRIGIYNGSGNLISNIQNFTFDFDSDNPREREKKMRFILSQEAEGSNNEEVFLKLEEPVKGTSQYKEYKKLKYTIRRSFTSDFDF